MVRIERFSSALSGTGVGGMDTDIPIHFFHSVAFGGGLGRTILMGLVMSMMGIGLVRHACMYSKAALIIRNSFLVLRYRGFSCE